MILVDNLSLEQLLALRFGYSRVASSLTVAEHGVKRQTASGYRVGLKYIFRVIIVVKQQQEGKEEGLYDGMFVITHTMKERNL